MAEMVKSIIDLTEDSDVITYTAMTGASDDYIDLSGTNEFPDQRVTLAVRNLDTTHNATITLRAGDGVQSYKGDKVFTVVGAATAVIRVIPLERVDSSRVKLTNGVNKGKIMVNGAIASGGTQSNVQMAVLCIA